MICPEEYVTLRELIDRRPPKLISAARETRRMISRMFEEASAESHDALRAVVGWAMMESVEDELERLVMAAVGGEMRLYHPEKGTLRLALAALETPNAEQSCTVFDLMDREISYDARDNYNLVHPDLQHELARGQPAAVLEAWNSSLRFQSTDGSIYNHFTVPWWHERRAYKIDLAIFDSLRASPAKGVELTLFSGVAEVLRPYSGALLCVPERFVASGFEDAINDVLERWTPGSALSKGSEGRGPGRPPELKESVKEAYRSLYPTGHGDIAKGVVLSAIVKRIGREASVQTLDRAIKEIGEERCIKQV